LFLEHTPTRRRCHPYLAVLRLYHCGVIAINLQRIHSETAGEQQGTGDSNDESCTVPEDASADGHLASWCENEQGIGNQEYGSAVKIGATDGSVTSEGMYALKTYLKEQADEKQLVYEQNKPK
jgi:hypothetical protein